jgi:hypothetical protein
LGVGAWNASNTEVTLVVTNTTGVTVWNRTQSMWELFSIPYTRMLQGFTFYMSWAALTNGVPIAPGEYTIVVSDNVDGHLLKVQGTVQVTG